LYMASEVYLTAFFFGNLPVMKGWLARALLWISLLALASVQIFGQQVALSLNSTTTTPGSSAVLMMSTSTNGGAQPAILQWTMQYPADVTSIEVSTGPAAANAGKTITCSYGVSVAICMAWGQSATVIADGAVAIVAFQVSAASRSSSIAVANTVGGASDPEGNPLPATSAGGIITVILPPTISCVPNSGPSLLNQYYSAQCSVTQGLPPYNWTVSSGALPAGISLTGQGTSAMISGTPTIAGVYRYRISAVDSNSPVPGSATLACAVTIESSAPKFALVGSIADLVANQDWTTTFTLVNTSADDAQTQLDLFGDDGNPLPLPLTLPQQGATESPVNTPSFDWTLASNASLIVRTETPANVPLQSGSAQLAATGGVGGYAIFHLNPTAQEAVVPLESRNASSYLLAFDNTNGAALGAAVANVAGQPANVSVVIRDDNGVQIGSGSLALSDSGHTSFVLSDLFPVTAARRGTVEFDTPSGGQISVLGVRTTPPGNLTSIPALVGVGTGGGAMAHIAAANGWKTTFVLVNTGTNAAQAHLQFFDDNGAPLILLLSFPQSGDSAFALASSVETTLTAGATLLIEGSGSDASPLQTGSAQLSTNGNVSGFGILRYESTGQEAVIPLESRNSSSYILAFDNTGGITTGVAVSSSSPQAVNVPVIIRDETGSQIGTSAIPLAANGHSAFVLGSQLPVTEGKRGTLEFTAPTGGQISVLGIRTPSANTFTTLPALTR
jgi:hypothetical protein